MVLLSKGKGFPGGSEGKESACNAGNPGSIPGLGRSPEKGNGNPLQYSCLENSMDREAWWATIYGITESDTTEQPTLEVKEKPVIFMLTFKPIFLIKFFLFCFVLFFNKVLTNRSVMSDSLQPHGL